VSVGVCVFGPLEGLVCGQIWSSGLLGELFPLFPLEQWLPGELVGEMRKTRRETNNSGCLYNSQPVEAIRTILMLSCSYFFRFSFKGTFLFWFKF